MVRRQRHVSALSIKKLVSIRFSAPCEARTFSVPVSGGAGRRVSLCVGRPAPRPQRNPCHLSARSRLLLDFLRGSLGWEFESLFMGYLGRSRVSNAVSGRAVCPSFTAGVLPCGCTSGPSRSDPGGPPAGTWRHRYVAGKHSGRSWGTVGGDCPTCTSGTPAGDQRWRRRVPWPGAAAGTAGPCRGRVSPSTRWRRPGLPSPSLPALVTGPDSPVRSEWTW